jgi:two-component system CheB/CheR fusion protein
VAGPSIGSAAAADVNRLVDRRLVERYGHPTLVVNDDGEAIEFRGDLHPWLATASGTPSFKLSKLLHPDLLMDVRTALFKARHHGEPVRRERVPLTRGTDAQLVNIEVVPAARSAQDRIYIITFEASAASSESEREGRRGPRDGNENERLQNELKAARDYMTHLTSEHEQSDSVLNAAGEELQSANEELQSTIEELETAKEELQSTNES